MKKLIIFLLALSALAPAKAESSRYGIIPAPKAIVPAEGAFTLKNTTVLVVEARDTLFLEVAGDFAAQVALTTGYKLLPGTADSRSRIVLRQTAGLGDEAYRLTVAPDEVLVEASSAHGAFYGIQTLCQLLPAAIYGDTRAKGVRWQAPCCRIEDEPHFPYRGMMLDVGRYFMPKETVKKFIDLMAMHKLNRLQWHLTEDQGWRIEIRKYPELTRRGAWRDRSDLRPAEDGRPEKDPQPYGGYYTRQQVREIVRYAADRFIEIVPEIEMPGHGLAALTSYPWLGCTGGPYSVWTHWGISDDVYCAGKETTFEFVEEVLSEVLDLFPSKLIHIGGDECPKSRWKACPHCQRRIREEGLKDEYELQSYFIRRIERWMHTRGREIIGWDEILQGGVSKTAIIMSWNGKEPGIKAARQGNPVIMVPKWHCYFDYSQTSDPDRYEPLGNPRYVPVRQVYRLEPCDQLALPDQKRIMGVQCNLWTEYIGDIGHAQHMVLPRMAALSEIGWACDRKDYNDFVRRVPALVRIYEAEGYRYAPYLFEGIE